MTRIPDCRKILILVCLFGLLAIMPAAAYELFDLGPGVVPEDINNTGIVVGLHPNAQALTTAFRFTIATGKMEDLAGTAAYAVNDAGQVAGNTLLGAFLQSGTRVQEWEDVSAFGINENGQLSGARAGTNPYRVRSIPYNPAVFDGSQWTSIDIAQVYPDGRLLGVFADIYLLGDLNDAGYAVGSHRRYGLAGSADIMISPPYSSLQTAADVTYLPTSGGVATAINNSNIVVGTTGMNEAFMYDGAILTLLGVLPGGTYSSAMDINESSTVVGSSGTATVGHAFVKPFDSAMQDLNDLVSAPGWVLTAALAVNELGDIVGTGQLNGQTHGFLLMNGNAAPVPLVPAPSPSLAPPIPQPPLPVP
jgi:uncharacterized membrane protein